MGGNGLKIKNVQFFEPIKSKFTCLTGESNPVETCSEMINYKLTKMPELKTVNDLVSNAKKDDFIMKTIQELTSNSKEAAGIIK
jgi:hypothetical protein